MFVRTQYCVERIMGQATELCIPVSAVCLSLAFERNTYNHLDCMIVCTDSRYSMRKQKIEIVEVLHWWALQISSLTRRSPSRGNQRRSVPVRQLDHVISGHVTLPEALACVIDKKMHYSQSLAEPRPHLLLSSAACMFDKRRIHRRPRTDRLSMSR